MKLAWNVIDKFKIGIPSKIRLFLLAQILISGLAGVIAWLAIGHFFLGEIVWLFCFAAYPAIFVGFIGGILYLYNHEFY